VRLGDHDRLLDQPAEHVDEHITARIGCAADGVEGVERRVAGEDRRCSSIRSGSRSRSQLQSIVARSVCQRPAPCGSAPSAA
jgi:hypothetical protein